MRRRPDKLEWLMSKSANRVKMEPPETVSKVEQSPNAAAVVDLKKDLNRFYSLLNRLAEKFGGPRELGTMGAGEVRHRSGVYFFFEPGEFRSGSGLGPRVVRVGTHALKIGSRSTLWGRLAQHRGSTNGGNHRGSVFRQLVGLAIAARHPELSVATWGSGQSAPPQIIEQERELEAQVSAVLAKMQVLWLPIDDDPAPQSLRGFVERNSIALLSSYLHPAIDPPSPDWLGHYCPRERVTKSGLWNSNHVDEPIESTFLEIFECLTESDAPSSVPTKYARLTRLKKSRTLTGTNADLIIAALQDSPDLDDDELARRTGVSPRQQVNMICRLLQRQGVLSRFTGPGGKIVNRLTEKDQLETLASRSGARQSSFTRTQPTAQENSIPVDRAISLAPEVAATMVIIPCSGRKSEGSGCTRDAGTLLDELPTILASRLLEARNAVAEVVQLDESTLMPAWRRYSGNLYERARLERAQDTCWFQHLLILSGGYGIVRAPDPIGMYDHAMNENDWPSGLLQEVIEAYARRHSIRRVIAMAGQSTGYARVLRKVAWNKAGVSEALLLTPEASPGAMVKAPRAIGEALATIIASELQPSWKSSDGLRMFARSLA